MDRSYLASICSIVIIVAICAWTLHPTSNTLETTSTLGGNAFQVAVANGAPVDPTPLAPLAVTIQANGGTLVGGTSISLSDSMMRYYTESDKPALLQAIVIELPGSAAARSALFTVTKSTNPDWAPEGVGSPLAATQSDDGTWYTLIDANQLAALRTVSGNGWYVFTGTATRGDETVQSRIAFYIQ